MADTGKIQPAPEAGRELDALVARRVLGCEHVCDAPDYSTDPGEALRHVWPKILERADGAVAILYSSASAHPGSPGAGYRIVSGGHYWSAFEIDVHYGPDVTAPTLAEAICRFALALYPDEEE